MGSEEKEAFHKADESPVHNVTVSPFFMAEVEVTWINTGLSMGIR